MKCPKCHFDNPSDSKFCKECGTQLLPSEEISAPTETLEAAKEELTTGSTFADRYQIIEELGKGGMGKVYKAQDTEIKEKVALKLIKPEIAADKKTIERFQNELKFARKISHRNVCRMYDLNKEEGSYYITMEYVSGEDLKSFIRRAGPLSAGKTISIAKQVCDGLEEAHRLGVVHRDLKPQNIMIDKEGNAHIMDFGIAHSLEAKGLTEAGMLIGTPDYMSPEQAQAEEIDHRSDIYSLGVVLYEMVTGRVPFEGKTAISIAMKHKTEIPIAPRELNNQISEEINAIILRCLEKDRENRFRTVEELLAELRAVEEGLSTIITLPEPQVPAFLAEGAEEVKVKKPVFVAREQEMDRLNKLLDKAIAGRGQVIFVTGEAGSGKTALTQEFASQAQENHPELVMASGKCNAHTGIGDPYLPFIELLALLTGDVEAKWTAGLVTQEHAVRLWNLLPLSVKSVLDNGRDLINTFVPGQALLSRSEMYASGRTNWVASLKNLVERKDALPSDSQLQQSSLFEQYTRVLQSLAQEKPLLLVLDDLQWIDAGSASLLFHLGRRIQGSPTLIIGAFRPGELALGRGEERHPLDPVIHEFKRDFGDIELEVGKTEDRQFIDALLDTEPNQLGDSFRGTLYRQTKGHPLFTVELLRDMQDRGVLVRDEKDRWVEGPELNWEALPARVDAVVEERISRLTEKLRDILTLASVEGEEFTAEVVASLKDFEVRELVRLLSNELDKRHHLVSAKGIRHLEKQRLSLYLFQHILFQRYLYNSLDEVQKAHLHEEVGNILETLYGEQAEEISVQLARHFLESGVIPKAVKYLHNAGNKAIRLSAAQEALSHLSKSLKLLKTLPETPERNQTELAILLALAVPFQQLKGLGAPEAGQAIDRAHELCQKIGKTQQYFTALSLLALFHEVRAEYRKALEISEQVKSIVDQAGDPIFSAIFNFVRVWPLLNVGEMAQAYEESQQNLDIYDPDKHGHLAYIYGYDMRVISLCFGGLAAWFLGYPEKTLETGERALALARKLDHPHTLAFCLTGACILGWFLGNQEMVDKYTEEMMPIAEEHGFVYWLAHGIFYRGEKKTLEGQVKEGIQEMRRGLEMALSTGTETCMTRLKCRMADACLKTGEIDEGLTAIAEAMEVMDKFDERYMEAELYRVKGELLKKKGAAESEIEELFHKALDISRKQQAKMLELRTTMSLGRLWMTQGKKAKARKMLEDIYGWFTEGFDFPDLKEAKAFLEELS
jgi:tRNA A-37 threonylcarbamoyl transferase component Bud32/tetratricopeptide (TPR) repeat protein